MGNVEGLRDLLTRISLEIVIKDYTLYVSDLKANYYWIEETKLSKFVVRDKDESLRIVTYFAENVPENLSEVVNHFLDGIYRRIAVQKLNNGLFNFLDKNVCDRSEKWIETHGM